MILGGGEITLLNLTSAYAILADQGKWKPPVFLTDEEASESKNIFSPGASFIVSEILRDKQARATGFGFDSVISTPYKAAV